MFRYQLFFLKKRDTIAISIVTIYNGFIKVRE